MRYVAPEKSDLLIAKAARRATLKWKAGESLRKKLQTSGADGDTTRKAMEDLAEVLREK